MRQEKYDRLKKMYDSKHFEDVCADAIEAVNAEKKKIGRASCRERV